MSPVAPNIPGPKLPEVHKVYADSSPAGNILHLLGNVLLAGARHINVVQVAGGVVAAHCLPEVVGHIGAGTVDKKWMEENGVSLLHVEVHPGPVLQATDTVVHLVHATLPLWVVMLQQLILV